MINSFFTPDMHLTTTALKNLLADGQANFSSSLLIDILYAFKLGSQSQAISVCDSYFKHLADLVVAHPNSYLSFLGEF